MIHFCFLNLNTDYLNSLYIYVWSVGLLQVEKKIKKELFLIQISVIKKKLEDKSNKIGRFFLLINFVSNTF
jgi:hypothetical protein